MNLEKLTWAICATFNKHDDAKVLMKMKEMLKIMATYLREDVHQLLYCISTAILYLTKAPKFKSRIFFASCIVAVKVIDLEYDDVFSIDSFNPHKFGVYSNREYATAEIELLKFCGYNMNPACTEVNELVEEIWFNYFT